MARRRVTIPNEVSASQYLTNANRDDTRAIRNMFRDFKAQLSVAQVKQLGALNVVFDVDNNLWDFDKATRMIAAKYFDDPLLVDLPPQMAYGDHSHVHIGDFAEFQRVWKYGVTELRMYANGDLWYPGATELMRYTGHMTNVDIVTKRIWTDHMDTDYAIMLQTIECLRDARVPVDGIAIVNGRQPKDRFSGDVILEDSGLGKHFAARGRDGLIARWQPYFEQQGGTDDMHVANSCVEQAAMLINVVFIPHLRTAAAA